MPTFDVTSEIDMQEVRNAVDQASREVATRFDFKNTGSSVELNKDDIELAAPTQDRLRALTQVLEEKLVRRQVSLKALDYGKVEEAAKGTVRQHVAVEGRHRRRSREEDQQDREGHELKGRLVPVPGRSGARLWEKARRPAGGDREAEGRGPGHPAPVRELPRLALPQWKISVAWRAKSTSGAGQIPKTTVTPRVRKIPTATIAATPRIGRGGSDAKTCDSSPLDA